MAPILGLITRMIRITITVTTIILIIKIMITVRMIENGREISIMIRDHSTLIHSTIGAVVGDEENEEGAVLELITGMIEHIEHDYNFCQARVIYLDLTTVSVIIFRWLGIKLLGFFEDNLFLELIL